MSTNYYIGKETRCHCCGAITDPMHIGKYAIGWKFNFRSYPEKNLTTRSEWEDHIRNNDGNLYDEYGIDIPASALLDVIEKATTGTDVFQIYNTPDKLWLRRDDTIDNGCVFSPYDFC